MSGFRLGSIGRTNGNINIDRDRVNSDWVGADTEGSRQ